MNYIIGLLLITMLCSCPNGINLGGIGNRRSTTVPTVPTSADVSGSIDSSVSSPLSCEALLNNPNEIKIKSDKWPDSWTASMSQALDEPGLGLLVSDDLSIRDNDLSYIGCPNLNRASRSQKKAFWIAFMAAIAVPESNHDPAANFCEPRGNCRRPRHPEVDMSRGLLQIGIHNADAHCPKSDGSKHTVAEIHEPLLNLRCGLYIMKNQVNGNKSGTNSNLRGRLFPTPGPYYWSVLTTNKKTQVKSYFQEHKDQLGFCDNQSELGSRTIGEDSALSIEDCRDVQDTGRQVDRERTPTRESNGIFQNFINSIGQ